MRRRSTFLHHPSLDIDSNQLYIAGNEFVIDKLVSAREERLTVNCDLDECPTELQQVLGQAHELHIRWTTQLNYNATLPFVSRTSPGLHVFYTPLPGQPGEPLCPLLQNVFSVALKCHSPETTFTTPTPISPRFASMASSQYYSFLPDIRSLVQYLQRLVCQQTEQQCLHTISLLNMADTVDIDYDSISHVLTFAAYWSRPPTVLYDPVSGQVAHNAWSLTIPASRAREKVEVGVLRNEPPVDPSEVKLSGFIATVGEDDQPNPTMFTFPSRHQVLAQEQAGSQTYTVSFSPPVGLHPTMLVSFSNASALAPPLNRPPQSKCSLHASLTLPSAIFADKYQLSTKDQLFLQSHNLQALRAISGETDLEQPDYVVQKWGSNVLVELALPVLPNDEAYSGTATDDKSRMTTVLGPVAWNVTIPLHTRYLPPSPSSSQSAISVPWPVVFWACTTEEGTKFSVNPFDRVNLGFDGLFGPRTMFFHLNPRVDGSRGGEGGGGSLVETISVPVLNLQSWGPEWIQAGTAAVIMAGFLWICLQLWTAGRGDGDPPTRRHDDGPAEKSRGGKTRLAEPSVKKQQ